jgi:hypothetical protein
MANKNIGGLSNRLQFGLGSPTLERAQQDLAVASQKEGSSFLGELGSVQGLMQSLLVAGALAAGEEEAAAYLGLQAASGAAGRSAQSKRKVAAEQAAATANVAAEEEKVRVEGVEAAQKAFAENPEMFIGSMMASGATNDEIDAALNITPSVKTNWSGYVEAQRQRALNDEIYGAIKMQLQNEPNPVLRKPMARAMLQLKGYKGDDIETVADAMATGTVDFEKFLPGAKDNFTPKSMLEAVKTTMITGDPMDGLDQLREMVEDPDTLSAIITKENREMTSRGQVELGRIIRDTGMMPADAVEAIDDEELRAFVRDNYTEWGFPGSQNELDLYLDIYQDVLQEHEEYNRYVRSIFTENWQELVYSPDDTITAARRILSGFMNTARGYYADVQARETEGTLSALRAAGFNPSAPETKAAFEEALEKARLELGDEAAIDDLKNRAIQLMQEN